MSDMDINALSPTEASEAFVRCCGSPVFGERMAAARPFRSHGAMVAASRRIWHNECSIRSGDSRSTRTPASAT